MSNHRRNTLFKSLIASSLLILLSSCGGGGSEVLSTTPTIPTPSTSNTGTDRINVAKSDGSSATPTTKDWTYMVYIAADNNLSSFGLDDINEMERVGSTDQVNVIAMAEFSETYSAGVGSTTYRGKVIKDDNRQQVSSLADMKKNYNMSDPQTLTDFIQWSKKNFPAKHYALVLWSHGNGWQNSSLTKPPTRGSLYDSTSGYNAQMSTPKIAKAIMAAGGVDAIDFDACIMGQYEVAYELKDAASILIAAADLEPGAGNDYTTLLQRLTTEAKAGSVSPIALGELSIESYVKQYDGLDAREQKAIIDLSQMGVLTKALNNFSRVMKANVAPTVTDVYIENTLMLAANNAYTYFQPGYYDIKDLMVEMKKEYANNTAIIGAADGVINALSPVTQIRTNKIVPSASFSYTHAEMLQWGIGKDLSGLSIFLPENITTDGTELEYSKLAINQSNPDSWLSLAQAFKVGLATQYGQSDFSFKLTWDDADANIDLVVKEPFATVSILDVSTLNAAFSVDSLISAQPVETYTTFAKSEAGFYYVFAHYVGHKNSAVCNTCKQTVTLWAKSSGQNDYTQVATEDVRLNPNVKEDLTAFNPNNCTLSSCKYLYFAKVVSP